MASKSKPTGRKRAYKIEDFYEPFPRQKEFHDSGAKYRLFGGAAGPGKTKALLYEAILQAHKHAGVDTLLMRRHRNWNYRRISLSDGSLDGAAVVPARIGCQAFNPAFHSGRPRLDLHRIVASEPRQIMLC